MCLISPLKPLLPSCKFLTIKLIARTTPTRQDCTTLDQQGLESASTIPEASCPLPRLYSFKVQAGIVPEAASVHPATQKCTISVPLRKLGFIKHDRFCWLHLPWIRWTFQTSHIICLFISRKHNLQKECIMFQTKSFSWNKSKRTEKFIHTT